MEAGKPLKAMVAYERAFLWQELFDIALQENLSQTKLKAVAYRIASLFITIFKREFYS